jgi:hypothetical protein
VRLFVITALLLLAGCGGDSLASTAAPDVLTGYLRYDGGPSTSRPVKVGVYRDGRRIAVQTASDSGRFRFRLARGTYDLRATAGQESCRLRVSVRAPVVHATLPCLGGFD